MKGRKKYWTIQIQNIQCKDKIFGVQCETKIPHLDFDCKGSAGHWFALLKARAIENQCYVIAAAQTGIHNPKRSSFGHACIIDPYGCVIAECPEGIQCGISTYMA